MRISIMQPTYLPYPGYFNLMLRGDYFVLLDDVQFSHQSWQQRNRIKTANGILKLTIPIKHKEGQLINEVQIDDTKPWRKKHLKSIEMAYCKSMYYYKYIDELRGLYDLNHSLLADFNIEMLHWFKQKLHINTKMIKSSQLHIETETNDKVERLIKICQMLNADEYLSPAGSKGYIDKSNLFEKNGIKLIYQHFKCIEYNQLHSKFIPYMSVLDLLMNEGDNAWQIIKDGETDDRTEALVN